MWTLSSIRGIIISSSKKKKSVLFFCFLLIGALPRCFYFGSVLPCAEPCQRAWVRGCVAGAGVGAGVEVEVELGRAPGFVITKSLIHATN